MMSFLFQSPETDLLEAIRKRLIPLGFSEAKDDTYPFLNFTRGDLLVRWIKDPRTQSYGMCIYAGTKTFQRPDGTNVELPKLSQQTSCPLSNKKLKESSPQILEMLDRWILTL